MIAKSIRGSIEVVSGVVFGALIALFYDEFRSNRELSIYLLFLSVAAISVLLSIVAQKWHKDAVVLAESHLDKAKERLDTEVTKTLKLMDQVIARTPIIPEIYYGDRILVFERLHYYATRPGSSILITNYFSGTEVDEGESSQGNEDKTTRNYRNKLNEKILAYYEALLRLPDESENTRKKYIRVIQLDDYIYDEVAPHNGKPIDIVIRNKKQLEHFYRLALKAQSWREKNDLYAPEIWLLKRQIPMTYTLLDEQHLLIQIDRPERQHVDPQEAIAVRGRNTGVVTKIWGVLVLSNPQKEYLDQFTFEELSKDNTCQRLTPNHFSPEFRKSVKL